MGSSHPSSKGSVLSYASESHEDNPENQVTEFQQCCYGVYVRKVTKKLITWEDYAYDYCVEMKSRVKCVWTDGIMLILNDRNILRNPFMREFNQLKYLEKVPSSTQKNSTLSPDEQLNFKSNLQRSVLLSCIEVTNPPKQPYKKIQSVIDTSSHMGESKKSSRFPSDLFSIENAQNGKQNNSFAFNRSSISKSKNKTFRSYARQQLMNLVDDTVTSIFKGEQKQISKVSAQALQFFIKFTSMLQKHLTNPQHKICKIIECFFESIYTNYCSNDKENDREQSSKNSSIDVLELQALIRDIKIFIDFVAKMVQDYYNLQSFEDDNKINSLVRNSQNIVTIVTSIIFKNLKFYNKLFTLLKSFNTQKQLLLQKKFPSLHNLPPSHFSIRPQFCLSPPPSPSSSPPSPPYLPCSQALQSLPQCLTPVSKMKCIVNCALKISEEVQKYYQQRGNLYCGDLVMDADQVLSVFCYVLTLNRIPDLYTHMFLIEQFATEHQKISISGYYFSVLECAIQENFGNNSDEIDGFSRKNSQNIQKHENSQPKSRQQTQSIRPTTIKVTKSNTQKLQQKQRNSQQIELSFKKQ